MSDRVVAVRQAAGGQWRAVVSPANPALRPFVVGHYVGWTEATTHIVRRRELPTLFVPVILSFGAPFRIAGADNASFFAGAHQRYSLVESSGMVECLQVNLTPDAAYRLLRNPMDDFADRIMSLHDVLGTDAARLIERLGNTKGWPARFDILDGFLSGRLLGATGLSPEVRLSLGLMAEALGDIAIGRLALETGHSRKRLIRAFRHQIGLPPKTIARVLRFNNAVRQLAGPAPNLAVIAQDAGYFDQAHFNRDFRAFSGVTPTAYLRERDPELVPLSQG